MSSFTPISSEWSPAVGEQVETLGTPRAITARLNRLEPKASFQTARGCTHPARHAQGLAHTTKALNVRGDSFLALSANAL